MKKWKWKQDFAPHILDRGEAYWLSGAVESLRREGDIVYAEVSGTELYDVELELRNGELVDGYCSCPYAEEGDYCKHMAAVLFRLTDEEPDGEPDQTQTQRNETLERQIAALSESKARELLLQLALKHPDGAELMEAASAGTVSPAQVRRWEQEIRHIGEKYEDAYGGFYYDESWEYSDDLTDLLNERVPILLSTGQIMEAFSLICTAASEAAHVELYEEDEGIDELFQCCVEHWTDVLQASDEAQREKQHDWFAGEYFGGEWEYGSDAVERVLFEGFSEEALLRKNLTLLDRRIREKAGDSASYAMAHLLTIRLETMKKLGMGREETDRFLEEHYAVPAVRKRMIDRAIEELDYDRAVALLKESKVLDRELPGLVRGYQETLIDLYRQSGRTGELREAVLSMLKEFWQSDLSYVKQLKTLTPPADWPALREELLSWQTTARIFGQILEEEKLYQRLLDWILERGQVYEMDRFAATLWPAYPEKLLAFYAEYLQRAMKGASNRKGYADLVRRLKGLKKYPKGTEETARLARAWRAAYPRRRAMLDELAKAGF